VSPVSLQVEHVTIDCTDPQALAAFWAEAVGGKIRDDWGEFVTVEASGVGIAHLAFQRVPEARAGKNRVHVDFRTPDQRAEVERLVGLGASVVAEHDIGVLTWTVLQDPEGNEFCVGTQQSS
jgi:predicted enzyme related to lactoylglutathione lyase